jgi:hypothetical protein
VAADVEIYASDNNEDLHTTCSGVRCVGTVRVAIDSTTIGDPSTYFLCVKLKFGTTELQVTAVDLQTNREQAVSLRFRPSLVPTV